MSIEDSQHKTNIYLSGTGFLSKCICGWQKEFSLSSYFSDNESIARQDAESSATEHLQESEIVRKYLSRVGTKGGKTKSQSKSYSSRLNGKKGGRPGIPIDIDALEEEVVISTGD